MSATVLAARQVPSSSGLNLISGSAVLAFPISTAQEDSNAVITVLSALLTNANFKTVTFLPAVSSDHESLDDFQWDDIGFNIENIVDGVSFDIRAIAGNNSWGNYNVNYIIGY